MQYISTGNVRTDDRVALFLLDQAKRQRLKIFARAEVRPVDESLRARLIEPAYEAVVERAYLFHVEAFDWNCPQHITPRFSVEELCEMGDDAVQAMLARSPQGNDESCAGTEPFKPSDDIDGSSITGD